MTYCVGVLLDRGLVLMSDTRTNSGVDNISVFRKMFHWSNPGERVIALMTAGNLATTQAVVSQLERGEVKLEESIALYERGAALKARCEVLLADAQEKVEKIFTLEDSGVMTRLEKLVKEVLAAKGSDAVVEKVTDLQQIAMLGVFVTPGLVIDGAVKAAGKMPTRQEIEGWIG